MKRIVMTLSLAALLVALVALAGCGGSGGVSSGGGGAGAKAADFSGMTLDGQQVSLESFKGKPLALVFWASW